VPGRPWAEEIAAALASARAAVLLVSADFLASDFIAHYELPELLKAAEERGTVILPLVVSPCGFLRDARLSRFQAVNDPRQPLIKRNRHEQELALARCSDRIAELLSTPESGE